MRYPSIRFGLWAAFIFGLSPCARMVQGALFTHISRPAVTGYMLIVGGSIGAAILFTLYRRKSPLRCYASLFAVISSFTLAAASLNKDPEEIFHLFEYGLLSYLCVAALAGSEPTTPARLAAALVTSSLGTVEELLQWILPDRVFDLRDIAINLFATLMIQLGLAANSQRRPAIASSTARDQRLLLTAALLQSSLLLVCSLLTPATVRKLVELSPALDFLNDEPVADFGHLLHVDPFITFPSHFSKNELQEIDRSRGAVVEQMLAHRRESREAFLALHSECRDPFVHEVEVHLFRRDMYLQLSREAPTHQGAAAIAYAEERILEDAFPNSVAHALWNEELRKRIALQLPSAEPYRSPVAGNLILVARARSVQSVLAVFCLFLAFLRLRCAVGAPGEILSITRKEA